MEQCLEWRHLAPTAPDTLTSYPFDAFDPFIIQSAPHVFFAGNQPEFGTRTVKGECVHVRVHVHICICVHTAKCLRRNLCAHKLAGQSLGLWACEEAGSKCSGVGAC